MTDLQDCTLAAPVPQAAIANLATALAGKPNGGQAAIADVANTNLILLADVISVLGETRTKFNTLLAELRTAGLLNA